MGNTDNKSGLRIAGFVIGIISFLTSWLGIGIILGIVGLPLSIVGTVKTAQKGLGIAGIILNALGVLLGTTFFILLTVFSYSGIQSRAQDASIKAGANSALKYAELFNAENDRYPNYTELRQRMSARVEQGTLESIGEGGSANPIVYVPCNGDGAIIRYTQSDSTIPSELEAGKTDSCRSHNL